MARYGDSLVRVRHRYDQQSGRSFKTVELIVEETAWKPRPTSAPRRIVEVRVDWQETQIRKAVRDAGGRWNPRRRVWELGYERVVGLGLEDRIVTDPKR